MAAPNFREILAVKTDAVERPRALGDGHYIGQVKNFEFGISKKKQTPFVAFIIQPTEETTDVADGVNEGINFANKELRVTYYLTPASLYRLSDALDGMLGKQVGRSFDQRIPETRSLRVMFRVTSREETNESGDVTNTFNDIDELVAAPG